METNILSLFDGNSGGQQSLNRVGFKYSKYFASEIHQPSIDVTQSNYPDTIQVGDVRTLSAEMFPKIYLLMAGSPCQGFSMSGKRKGMVTEEHIKVDTLEKYIQLKADGFKFHGQSYLFWEFVRMIKECKPQYFFLENVHMKPEWKYIISSALGVEPIIINSSKVSGQNRLRYYWTNIPVSEPIQDLGITLDQIIPGAISGAGKRGVPCNTDPKYKYKGKLTVRKDLLANCLTTVSGLTDLYLRDDGEIVQITPEEAELLQTMTKGYTNVKGITEQQRRKMIGNGWTIDVICYFFKNLKTTEHV
jgi:DNA (cytosine-5)-methyltransferase 3A